MLVFNFIYFYIMFVWLVQDLYLSIIHHLIQDYYYGYGYGCYGYYGYCYYGYYGYYGYCYYGYGYYYDS